MDSQAQRQAKAVGRPDDSGSCGPDGGPAVLGSIFEADLQLPQHAYRSAHGAHDALREVHRLVNTGHMEVVDADVSGYFDSIPHAERRT